MGKASGFSNDFNAGELEPDAYARTDLQQHAHGCAQGLNFVGLVPGPMGRRAGFWDAGAVSDEDKLARLIPFKRSSSDALMLEFGDETVLVWKADYTPLMDGMAQVQFASPYTEAQIAGIRWCQSGDVLYLTHADTTVRTRTLVRTSNTSWAFNDLELRNGPFRPENLNRGLTITASAWTANTMAQPGASVSLVASAPLFDAGHVDALFALRQNDGSPSIQSWVSDTDFNEGATGYGQFILSDGKIYKYDATGANRFGTTPPIHESGTVSDGQTYWAFQSDGRGIVQITAVTDSTHATATVIATLPFFTASVTSFWSEGAWSDYRGWPTAWPAIREERLLLGAEGASPDQISATRTAGYGPTYADFKPGLGTGRVVDDDGFRAFIGQEAARIVALISSFNLLALTTDAEHIVAGGSGDEPLAPAAVIVRNVSDYGSAELRAVRAHQALLYCPKAGLGLRAVALNQYGTTATEDMAPVASHITGRQIVELAWIKQDNLLYARLADGGLAVFAYHAEQEVKGWYSQSLGDGSWSCESLAVLPGYGDRDALWMVVSRTKGGATQRRIWVASARRDKLRLDAARLYAGDPVGTVDGLEHLAGEDVLMMAGPGDGTYAQFAATVNGDGEASLPNGIEAAEIRVGQPYLSRFVSLPLDLGGPGTTQGRRTRLTQGELIWTGIEARAGQVGGDFDPLRAARQPGETGSLVEKRQVSNFTFDGGADRDPRVVVECDNGFDLILAAIRPSADVNA